ncbi:MAG: DUF1801 domain-containing protein [Flavobacteriales bacterium]|nr:DUF1801 domain-containing protein [Flavobacteriales bacterium]
MHKDILTYHKSLSEADRAIASTLAAIIEEFLPEAESKLWHAHPVWFLEGNPIVGYSRLKAGMRLMFWSGRSFDEEKLIGTSKFKDAQITFTSVDEINKRDLKRWLKKSREIQWDYKNIVMRKGQLERLK